MSKSRSNIEVFFEALGHKDVQAALSNIAKDAKKTSSEVNKLASNFDFGGAEKFRNGVAEVKRDLSFVNSQISRMKSIIDSGLFNKEESETLREVKVLYDQIGKRIDILQSKSDKGIASKKDIKELKRLSVQYIQLEDVIERTTGAAAQQSAKLSILNQRLKSDYQDSRRELVFLKAQLSKVKSVIDSGLFTQEDLVNLDQLNQKLGKAVRNAEKMAQKSKDGIGSPSDIANIERLQKEYSDLADEAEKTTGTQAQASAILKKKNDELKSSLESVSKELGFVRNQFSKIKTVVSSGIFNDDDIAKLSELNSKFSRLGEEIKEIQRSSVGGVLSAEDNKKLERLTILYTDLREEIEKTTGSQAQLNAVMKIQGDALRDQFKEAGKDLSFLRGQFSKMKSIVSSGLFTNRDEGRLAILNKYFEALGRELEEIKKKGLDGLLTEDEIKNVQRTRIEYEQLKKEIEETTGVQARLNAAMRLQGNALRDSFRDASKEQTFLQQRLSELASKAKSNSLVREDLIEIKELRVQYENLGRQIDEINAKKANSDLSENEIKDLNRLISRYNEVKKQIDEIQKARLGSSIRREALIADSALKVLKFSANGVFKALDNISRLSFGGIRRGLSSSASALTAFARSGFGVRTAFNLLTGSINLAIRAWGQLRNAVITFGFATFGVVRGINGLISANNELSGSVLALRSLNDEISSSVPRFVAEYTKAGTVLRDTSGVFSETAQDFRNLNIVANEHGIRVNDITKGYLKLKASSAGLEVTRSDLVTLFDGLADANQVIGGSQDTFDRATTALQQIASKGKVMAEELRGQLAEAIPGAIATAARAYNMATADFLKEVELGNIDAAGFIKRFGDQLQKEYSAGAKSLENTTRVAQGRLRNALFNARALVANDNLDRVFGRGIRSLTRIIDRLASNGGFRRFGQALAGSLDLIVSRLEKAEKSGFNFEKILNIISSAFDKFIKLSLGFFDAAKEAAPGIKTIFESMGKWGFSFDSVVNAIKGIGTAITDIADKVNTRNFTGNRFTVFIALIISISARFVKAVNQMLFPKESAGSRRSSIVDTFDRLLNTLVQIEKALYVFTTGDVYGMEGMNLFGLRFLVMLFNINNAIDKVKENLKGLGALLTGQATPEDASTGMRRAFGFRGAVGNLITGRENTASQDPNAIYDPESLDLAFKFRDAIKETFQIIKDNQETIFAFLEGARDAFSFLLGALKVIQNVFEFLGFEGTGGAWALGFLFVLSKVPGAAAVGAAGLKILSGLFSIIAIKLGIATATLATLALGFVGIIAATYVLGRALYTVWQDQDKFMAGLDAWLSKFVGAFASLSRLVGLDTIADGFDKIAKSFKESSLAYSAASKNIKNLSPKIRNDLLSRGLSNEEINELIRGASLRNETFGWEDGLQAVANKRGLDFQNVDGEFFLDGQKVKPQNFKSMADSSLFPSELMKSNGDLTNTNQDLNESVKQLNESVRKGLVSPAVPTPASIDSAVAQANAASGINPSAGQPVNSGFNQPIKIYLDTGQELDVLAKSSDNSVYKDLSTKTRPGRSPVWMGA